MNSKSSSWVMDLLKLRFHCQLIESKDFNSSLLKLVQRTREKWPPHERHLYWKTLEQERALTAQPFIIKDIFTGIDHGTAGDASEEVWADLLRDILPQYEVVTKGVIGGIGPIPSPQIDILILEKNFPRHLRSGKLYPIDSVVAAFECKLSLRLDDIKNAVETASILNGINSTSRIDPINHVPIFYGVLALSDGIENAEKPSYQSVLDAIKRHTKKPDTSISLLDSVLVAGGFCLVGKRTLDCYDIDEAPMDMTFERVYEYHGHQPEDARPADSFLGLFIHKLLSHLEKRDPSLSATRKMYDLFVSYYLNATSVTSADLKNYIQPEYIKKIGLKLYEEDKTVYTINI